MNIMVCLENFISHAIYFKIQTVRYGELCRRRNEKLCLLFIYVESLLKVYFTFQGACKLNATETSSDQMYRKYKNIPLTARHDDPIPCKALARNSTPYDRPNAKTENACYIDKIMYALQD